MGISLASPLVEDSLLREVEALYFDYAMMLDEEILLWPDLFTEATIYRAMSRSMKRSCDIQLLATYVFARSFASTTEILP